MRVIIIITKKRLGIEFEGEKTTVYALSAGAQRVGGNQNALNIEEQVSKIARNSVFDCHLSPALFADVPQKGRKAYMC